MSPLAPAQAAVNTLSLLLGACGGDTAVTEAQPVATSPPAAGAAEVPFPDRLAMQPVIHLDADGQGAAVRSRMMQQLSFSARPSMGAAVYENRLIRENGKWKFLSTHAFNTWTAGYDGGWIRSPGNRVPGPSETFPPDGPPSVEFAMFPTVYDIPVHYANPVTGRR